MNCQICTCLTNDTGFISTIFFRSQANFEIFAEIRQKKMLKIYVVVWHHIPTSEFLCLIANKATDAIKSNVHMVNMKLRKLRKNNAINTNKPRSGRSARIVLHGHGSVGIKNKNSSVEIKPVSVVKQAWTLRDGDVLLFVCSFVCSSVCHCGIY